MNQCDCERAPARFRLVLATMDGEVVDADALCGICLAENISDYAEILQSSEDVIRKAL